MTARITYVASGDHPDDPMWEFPHELWILPHNARTFGEMVSAPRRRYVLADAPDPRDEVIRRLVEVLEPLASMAEWYDPDEGNDGHLECWSGLAVPKIQHLRTARAALTATKEQLK